MKKLLVGMLALLFAIIYAVALRFKRSSGKISTRIGNYLEPRIFDFLVRSGLIACMAERTVVASVTGVIMYISATLPETYDAAGYQTTDFIWTEIGEVEDAGSEDATKAVNAFTPVKTAVTTKVPGAIDYGKRTVTVGYMPGDDGQALVKTAFGSVNHYSLKMLFPDGEIRFLDVLVTKNGLTGGTAGEVARGTFEFDICRAPVVVLP